MGVAFVTGGTGFIGSHLIESLLADGIEVRALVRDPARPRFCPIDRVTPVIGDLDDPDALRAGIDGADVVYHGAALTRAPTEDEMMRVNRDGTRNVLDACAAETTPPRLVFLSSQAAAGPSPDGRPVVETSPAHPCSSYGRSKLAAEALLAEQSRVPVATVRPPSVYGPRDDGFLALFRYARRGFLPLPSGARGLSIVHVDDLVRGLRLAERAEGVYYLTDGPARPMREILGCIAAAVGRRARLVPVSRRLFMTGVWIAEHAARLVGQRPPMTVDRAHDAVAVDWICSDARARAELGYRSSIDLADGMAETARWYTSEGWL